MTSPVNPTRAAVAVVTRAIEAVETKDGQLGVSPFDMNYASKVTRGATGEDGQIAGRIVADVLRAVHETAAQQTGTSTPSVFQMKKAIPAAIATLENRTELKAALEEAIKAVAGMDYKPSDLSRVDVGTAAMVFGDAAPLIEALLENVRSAVSGSAYMEPPVAAVTDRMSEGLRNFAARVHDEGGITPFQSRLQNR